VRCYQTISAFCVLSRGQRKKGGDSSLSATGCLGSGWGPEMHRARIAELGDDRRLGRSRVAASRARRPEGPRVDERIVTFIPHGMSSESHDGSGSRVRQQAGLVGPLVSRWEVTV